MGKLKTVKTITVFGKKYKIKVVPEHYLYEGLCDAEKGIILLRENCSQKEMLKTIIHEVTHSWQFRIGLHQAISRELLEIIAEVNSVVLEEIFDIKFKDTKRAKKK